jgi:hypothetical protein
MSAARKIHTLTFHLLGITDEDAADELIDDIEEFADDIAWPIEHPDAYKYKQSEADTVFRCAVELPVRASLGSESVEVDKATFAGAMALMEHLRRLSARHGLEVEVDFDTETIGVIDKGVFSPALREALIDPWQAV